MEVQRKPEVEDWEPEVEGWGPEVEDWHYYFPRCDSGNGDGGDDGEQPNEEAGFRVIYLRVLTTTSFETIQFPNGPSFRYGNFFASKN